MHGCKRFWNLVVVAILSGCGESPATERKSTTAPPILGEAFDPKITGTIEGSVTWQGDLPQIAPFTVYGLPGDYPIDVRKDQPNPNAPRIGERRGSSPPESPPLEGVVVYLRKVDLKKSRPWDNPKVHIEQRDRRLLILQGETLSNVGWVRAGDDIAITNNDVHFHMLRGRGADFFSLPFADRNVPGHRRLEKTGLVELSSGAFFFWMHGYLLVDHHPYYTRTDAQGKFTLDKVPAGSYDLVCWMPNWEVTRKLRDPETALIVQVDFAPPVEHVQTIQVDAGKRQEASFTWFIQDFATQR